MGRSDSSSRRGRDRGRDSDRDRDRDGGRRRRESESSDGESRRRRRRDRSSSSGPSSCADMAAEYARENQLSEELERRLRELSPEHLKAVVKRGPISKANVKVENVVEGRIRAESRKWQKNRKSRAGESDDEAPLTGRWGRR
eukprot:TRINITY_DN17137_c0_g1_i1.p1 TRINITY_DN17137_c0_g1~~TRINITY_DN17137_c0_g1_i1.p1  ORF type:complete len:142 (+),score=25.54 TRINITY_DN17137_c0_g1_i1:66-491(+)